MATLTRTSFTQVLNEIREVIDVTIVPEGIRHLTATFDLVADRVASVQITQFVATNVDDLKRHDT